MFCAFRYPRFDRPEYRRRKSVSKQCHKTSVHGRPRACIRVCLKIAKGYVVFASARATFDVRRVRSSTSYLCLFNRPLEGTSRNNNRRQVHSCRQPTCVGKLTLHLRMCISHDFRRDSRNDCCCHAKTMIFLKSKHTPNWRSFEFISIRKATTDYDLTVVIDRIVLKCYFIFLSQHFGHHRWISVVNRDFGWRSESRGRVYRYGLKTVDVYS